MNSHIHCMKQLSVIYRADKNVVQLILLPLRPRTVFSYMVVDVLFLSRRCWCVTNSMQKRKLLPDDWRIFVTGDVSFHDDVIKWKHQSSALLALCAGNSPVTGEFPAQRPWRGALIFCLICAWLHGWVNNRKAGDLRRRRAHCDVTVMSVLVLKVFFVAKRQSFGRSSQTLKTSVNWTPLLTPWD